MQEPNVDEMLTALKRRAELRGRIKVLELEIKEAEIPIRKSNPRKPELRDEVTIDLQREKVKYEVELEQVESTIEYINFYSNIWKYTQFNVSKAII
jgi:hypothetical protein